MSHKFSTALRNVGTGAALVGCATLQGVDPASPANLLDSRTSTRPSFARHEFCETCGLELPMPIPGHLGKFFQRGGRGRLARFKEFCSTHIFLQPTPQDTQVTTHGSYDLPLWDGNLTISMIGAAKWVFKVHGNGSRKAQFLNQFEIGWKVDHASSERNVPCLPSDWRIRRP